MTPEYVLRKSLCRLPHCAGPYELRDTPLKDWPASTRLAYIHAAESQLEYMQYANGYSEPGYDQPKHGVLLGNWNYFSNEAADLLEKMGYSIEWEDEWEICDDCGKCFRTSPDCYFWQPSGHVGGNGSYCHECNPLDEEILEDEYENRPTRAVNLRGVDLTEFGYRQIQGDYQSGEHTGMNDDPQKIYEQLRAEGHKHIVFKIDETSQFYLDFSVWEKVLDEEEE